jgi:hypothetical protein
MFKMAAQSLSTEELVEVLFSNSRPPQECSVDLCMLDAQTPSDIFWGCLNLLCRGLVKMFGNSPDENSQAVCLDTLSMTQFNTVADRLLMVGIKATARKVESLPPDHSLPRECPTNLLLLARRCWCDPQVTPGELELLLRLSSGEVVAVNFDLIRSRDLWSSCGVSSQRP